MSYSDYIYQERLRDQVDALKADLALATAREAALREVLVQEYAPAQWQCRACGTMWVKPRWPLKHHDSCLLADPGPAAERLLRIEAAARAVRDADMHHQDARSTTEHEASQRAYDDALRALFAALADMEANRG